MHLHQNLLEDHCRPSLPGVAPVRRKAARLVVQSGAHLLLALVVTALVLSPRLLVAQTAPEAQQDGSEAGAEAKDETFFGEEHRRQMYEQSRLSTTRAVLYNLAVPGLGNVYAEQYFYGGIAFTLTVFALVFAGYGLVTDQAEFLWIGGGTAAIAYTGSIVTSIYGVRDYNEKLRQGLKLEGAFSQAGASPGPWRLPRASTIDVSFRF